MTRTLSLFLAGLLALAAIPATADDRPPGWMAPEPPPVLEVTVTRLTGLGPDNRRHLLYQDPAGVEVVLGRPKALQEALRGRPFEPNGAYHTLKGTLADSYRAIESDGSRRTGKLSEDGRPSEVRIRGMVLVRDGRMEPLGMTEPRRQPRRPARDHDEDDDEDDDEEYEDDD